MDSACLYFVTFLIIFNAPAALRLVRVLTALRAVCTPERDKYINIYNIYIVHRVLESVGVRGS